MVRAALSVRVRSWTPARRRELLSGVPVFSTLPAAITATLAEVFLPKGVERGGFIFREGDVASAVNLAAEGRIKIVRETEAGRQVVLRLVLPGQSFGVASSWGAAIYPASARALDDAVVLQLPARAFARLLEEHAALALAVIRDLGARLREAEARILDLETVGVEARIARALLRLTDEAGPSLALTRQDLADLTGTTLSTASRTVSAWHRLGLVAALREEVIILDRDRLAVVAAGTQ